MRSEEVCGVFLRTSIFGRSPIGPNKLSFLSHFSLPYLIDIPTTITQRYKTSSSLWFQCLLTFSQKKFREHFPGKMGQLS